jgi:hypothetical protein
VVSLLNIFVKMGILRKLYSTNKSFDFQDNRDLFEFTEATNVEQENKENIAIDSQSMIPRDDLKSECSKMNTSLSPKSIIANGSMNASYLTANRLLRFDDCLRCAVETKGNQILRFLTKISLQRWPLTSMTTNQHQSNQVEDEIDGRQSALEMNELRYKSMQLLGVHQRSTSVSNPFSKTNPLYRTMGGTRAEIAQYSRVDSNYQEPIYNRSLHPNSLKVEHSKLHQRSFNTLV